LCGYLSALTMVRLSPCRRLYRALRQALRNEVRCHHHLVLFSPSRCRSSVGKHRFLPSCQSSGSRSALFFVVFPSVVSFSGLHCVLGSDLRGNAISRRGASALASLLSNPNCKLRSYVSLFLSLSLFCSCLPSLSAQADFGVERYRRGQRDRPSGRSSGQQPVAHRGLILSLLSTLPVSVCFLFCLSFSDCLLFCVFSH
jgi:hypothetical protein